MFDAIVFAGATSRRLDGADKALVEIGGRTLLDTVLAATEGANRVIVAGPQRAVGREAIWVQEQPPGGGPVAAMAPHSPRRRRTVLVLATDLPRVADAVPRLLTAAAHADVAVLTRNGPAQPPRRRLAHHRAGAALDRLPTVTDAAMHTLFDQVAVEEVIDTEGWGVDVDTWADVEAVRGG